MLFVDTSVLVAARLAAEPLSAPARKSLKEAEGQDPVIDTVIAMETFLVLRSKIGTEAAQGAVQEYLKTLGYRPVARSTIVKALANVDGIRLGDAAIIENVRANRATLLTLDRKQAEALGDRATLVR